MRSTLRTERLSALAIMHSYRDNPIDPDIVIRAFCAKKNRRLALHCNYRNFVSGLHIVIALRKIFTECDAHESEEMNGHFLKTCEHAPL
jgi:hypothetical protein